jgi:hypothetical protein
MPRDMKSPRLVMMQLLILAKSATDETYFTAGVSWSEGSDWGA